MGWNFKSLAPHVNLLVHVHAGDDKEDSRTSSSSCQQPAQPEDDGPLVLLHHLDHQAQGEGERRHDQEEGAEDQYVGTEALGLLTS